LVSNGERGQPHPGSDACRCTILHGGAVKWWLPRSWEQCPDHFSTKQLRVCRPESGAGSITVKGQPYGLPYSDNSQSSYDNNMPLQSQDPPSPAQSGSRPAITPLNKINTSRINLGNGVWRGGEHVAGAERPAVFDSLTP